MLWKLLATSQNVSALPTEGQFLPELKALMRAGPWQRDHALPWAEIKAVWESYWDHDKAVLLEKSPPNLIRGQELRQHFDPARFVIMVRNPYAHAEGLMRRNGWSVQRAGNFTMMCLRTQLQNTRELDASLVLTYEALVQDPAAACARLATFVPELADMDPGASFEVHSVDGTLNRPITDLNAKKIAALSPDTLAALNTIFSEHQETIEGWGYELVSPAVAG